MSVQTSSRNTRSWLASTTTPGRSRRKRLEQLDRLVVEVVGRLVEQQAGRAGVVISAASASRVRWPPDRVPRPASRSMRGEPEAVRRPARRGGRRPRRRGRPRGRAPRRTRPARPRSCSVARRARSTRAHGSRSGAQRAASTSPTVASSGNGGSWSSSPMSAGRARPRRRRGRCRPAGEQPQQRGLAGAVLADQADAPARLGEQVDAAQDGAVPEPDGEDAERRRGEAQAWGGPSVVVDSPGPEVGSAAGASLVRGGSA